MELKVKINDPIGLHARPAAQIVKIASNFECDLTIKAEDGRDANLKSIMSVMALGIRNGEEVVIVANGADAEDAIATLEKEMKEQNLI